VCALYIIEVYDDISLKFIISFQDVKREMLGVLQSILKGE